MRVAERKITTREELAPKIAVWRKEGKVVGFTSGAFDIVHAGHVSYLETAQEKCDVLIVGVNSDESVRGYKGPGRPIVPEESRMKLVAALESVDYVFPFAERRNRQNLEILQPSLYIKAGDYTPEQLTSADTVKKYGGKVLILPLEGNFSTSHIIKKVARLFDVAIEEDATDAIQAKTEQRDPQKAILIDRDGTINTDIEYLHEPEKFTLLPNAAEGLRKFQEMGYKIVIITLQAGIGLGYFTKEDFFRVNRELFSQLAPHGVIIDKIYFATHSKTPDGANAKERLVEQARADLDLDLQKSVIIGDKFSDLAAGEPYGCRKIGVKTGKGLQDGHADLTVDYVADDVLDAAFWAAMHLA